MGLIYPTTGTRCTPQCNVPDNSLTRGR
ncbi:uncharacterized protein G2W53_044629 [Senna tora]|uniref:Uncharacterized protein n=1 Tax=Senna tora TaxID=362788 RepID=A0A834SEF6_9FABA|nr:uncharacterized protein G2W53_044629 [Senna tora]